MDEEFSEPSSCAQIKISILPDRTLRARECGFQIHANKLEYPRMLFSVFYSCYQHLVEEEYYKYPSVGLAWYKEQIKHFFFSPAVLSDEQSALLGWFWGLPSAKALRLYITMGLWR